MEKQFTTIHLPKKHYAVFGSHQEKVTVTKMFETETDLVRYLLKKYNINLKCYNGKGYPLGNPTNTCRTIWTLI